MREGLFLLVALTGCKMKDATYQNDRADNECTYALACYDDPTKSFLGYTNQDACVKIVGSEIAGQGVGCTYDAKAAAECVKAWKDLAKGSCPADGTSTTYPAVCDQVYTLCPANGDTGTSDTGT